jgi:predicted nucleic acid-binding Zn finger protein
MAVSEERILLEHICDVVSSEGRIAKVHWERLRSIFGERFDKAWRLVEEKRIKRYIFNPSNRVAWIAVGRDGEYQILPLAGYCSCNDFYYRVVDEETGLCYHLIAQRLAEALNSYEEINEGDEFFDILMAEWRRQSLERRS